MTALAHNGSDDISGTDSLPKDAIHSILSNARRRHTLEILSRVDSLDRGELSTRVAAKEYNKPACEITSKERKRVHVSLYQCHLPKLEDHGVIEQQDNQVSLCDGTDRLLSHLHYDPQETFTAKIRHLGNSIL